LKAAKEKADNKAAKEKAEEKKVKVPKKKKSEEKATMEVVQMVQEMKTAFTEAVQENEKEKENVLEEEEELVVDMYIGEPDSIVDFDALRLDEGETPMAAAELVDPVELVDTAEEEEAVNVINEVVNEVTINEVVNEVTINPIPDPEPKEVVRTVFRHEFSPECFRLLSEFSRANFHLPRKAYKQNWEHFTDANAEFISQESARLADAGYTGDVLVKMFKTAKYYLTKREKKATTEQAGAADAANAADAEDDDDATISTPPSPTHAQSAAQSQVPPRRRRSYIALDRAVLQAMDVHITNVSDSASSSSSSSSKPSVCYTSFCEQFRELIEMEVARLARLETGPLSENDAQDKLKKTYKNRMFCSALKS